MGEVFAFLLGAFFGVALGFTFSALAVAAGDRDDKGEEDKNWWE